MPKVLVLEGPDARALLRERARLGIDGRDELWIDDERVIHVVPPPHLRHQDIEMGLVRRLVELAERHGLEARTNTGVYDPHAEQYRVPDIVVFDREHTTARGLEGNAAVVIEVVSPGDESWDKVAFYLEVGCSEVVLVDRGTLEVAIVRHLDDDGEPVVAADTTIAAVDLTLERRTDDHLHLSWDGGEADVRL